MEISSSRMSLSLGFVLRKDIALSDHGAVRSTSLRSIKFVTA